MTSFPRATVGSWPKAVLMLRKRNNGASFKLNMMVVILVFAVQR
jgi:hypothetical protein